MAKQSVCVSCGFYGRPKQAFTLSWEKLVCPKCGGSNLIPPDSPVGRKMLIDSGISESEVNFIIDQEKTKNKPVSDKWKISIAGVIVVAWFVMLSVISGLPNPASETKDPAFGDYQSVKVGDEAYLWIAHEDTTRGLVCLGETKNDYSLASRAILSGDYIGLLEIPGAFCVGSGTRVLLIEKDFPLRKVRILQGAGEVDNDKIGFSGWTAMEYVASK